jgi:hypothetical protein
MKKSLFYSKPEKKLKQYWDAWFGLDDKNSILVEVEDLGAEKNDRTQA